MDADGNFKNVKVKRKESPTLNSSFPFLSFISLNNDLSFSNREVTILTSKSMSTVLTVNTILAKIV